MFDRLLAGVRRLGLLSGLQSLNLLNTQTTDAAIPDLASLTGVRRLVLSRTPHTTSPCPSHHWLVVSVK